MKLNNRFLNRANWLIYALALNLVLMACQTNVPTVSSPSDRAHRVVGPSSLRLNETWRYSYSGKPVISISVGPLPNLLIADGKVFFPYTAENGNAVFTALALETGQIAWQTPYTAIGSYFDSMTLDAKHWYFACGFRVSAFDLRTGKLTWETDELGQHASYFFRPGDSIDPLQIHMNMRQQIITIDPATGIVLRREPEQTGLLTYGSIEFIGTQRELQAYDWKVKRVLWRRPSSRVLSATRQMNLWPTFIGDDVVFLSDEVTYAITRAEVRTGKIRWQTEAVYVSNIAIDDATARLYVMRQDGVLVVLDVNTGKQLDEVKISGPLIDPQEMAYSVAVSGPYILIHFVDTQELVALRAPSGQ